MITKINILSQIIKNENETTELFYGLLSYKPFRVALINLFTGSSENSEFVTWDDIYLQKHLQINSDKFIPDLSILNHNISILVEIKTDPRTKLTDNQPKTYMDWLANKNKSKHCYFVAVIPPDYAGLEKLNELVQSHEKRERTNKVNSKIFSWDDIVKTIKENDLDQLNVYIDDFCKLLSSWYNSPAISFSLFEVKMIYSTDTAKAMKKLMSLMEQVLIGLKQKNFKVETSFNKKWWEDGEYSIYALRDNDCLLYFGLWQDFWEKNGAPLSIGVDKEWNVEVVNEFAKRHPDAISFVSGDSSCEFYVIPIPMDILMSDDATSQILEILNNEISALTKVIPCV